MAAALGVASRTYANYERDERLPDAEVLGRLVAEGWNANWLLTGEGPERLADLGGSPPAAAGTQSMRTDTFRMVVEMIDEELAAAGVSMPSAKRARAYQLCYEIMLEDGDSLPLAQVVKIAVRAAA